VVSAEENEDPIAVRLVGEGVPAREDEAVRAFARRARRDRHAGPAPEAMPIPLENDLNRGWQDAFEDLFTAGFPEAAHRAPRTQRKDDDGDS
jgi:hypothetical protein